MVCGGAAGLSIVRRSVHAHHPSGSQTRRSSIDFLAAFGFALIFLWRHELIWSTESHVRAEILGTGPGYSLCIMSILMMVIANADELMNGLKRKPPERQ